MQTFSQKDNQILVYQQTNTINIDNLPQIKIIEGIPELNESIHVKLQQADSKDSDINEISENKEDFSNNIVQLSKQESTNSNTNGSNQVSAMTSPKITSQTQQQGSKQGKLKITTQNLEKLSSEEKFDLALIALNKPANSRNPIEQKLIEDTIDSFAYIQKMKKRKPTLAKQISRVVEYQNSKKGQAVFYAGQQPEKFYLILRGKVAVLLKKSDAQIQMDRKNGKFINLQSVLDKSYGSNIANHQFLEKSDTQDAGSGLNTPRQSNRPNPSPSLFSSSKSNNNNNSSFLHNNSYLASNNNQISSFANKLTVSGLTKNSQSIIHKPTYGGMSSSQIYNEKGSDSASSTENSATPQDLGTQINFLQREDTKLGFYGDQNTPSLLNNLSKLSLNWQRSAVQFKNNISTRFDSKQSDNISKNINLTPDELEEPEKFYDNGVFRYEFAKELQQLLFKFT